jgi:DUF3102 family protein
MTHTPRALSTQDHPAATPQDLSTSNSLADLAARIRAEHEAALLSMKRGLEHTITAGGLLLEAKAQLAHGQWLPWLREVCPSLPERTASHYMRLARHADELRTESANIADLTVREAIALIANPTVAEAISEPESGPAGQLDRTPWLEMLWRFRLELAAIDPRIEITPTSLRLPDGLSYDNWKMVGALLKAFFGPHYAAAEVRS